MKIRVRFSKYGSLRFLGHLDVMHFFQRLLRRSGIPIAYSTGMSPHQIMSFAQPLSVGLESYGEYMDIELTSAISTAKAIKSLNENTAEGIEILSFKELPEGANNAMASIKAADYLVRFREGYESCIDLSKEALRLFERDELIVSKKTKKSIRDIDLLPLIYEHGLRDGGLYLRLSAGSTDNIKPELVMEALLSEAGKELIKHSLFITRLDMFTGEKDAFISLDSVGHDIE